MSKFPTKPSQYWPYLLLALTCSVLMLVAHIMMPAFDVYALLRYDRSPIAMGENWRLITGHFLHTNFIHFAINMLGLSLLWMLHGDYCRPLSFLLNVITLCLGISLCIWFWSSSIHWYVGLSGVLHGLFAWGIILDIQHGRKSAYLLFIGLILKLIEEQITTDNNGYMSELIAANVAIDAHLYGAVLGLILGLFSVLIFSNKLFNK